MVTSLSGSRAVLGYK